MSISARTRQSTWSTDAPEASGARNLGICLIGGLPHCFYRRAARGVADGGRVLRPRQGRRPERGLGWLPPDRCGADKERTRGLMEGVGASRTVAGRGPLEPERRRHGTRVRQGRARSRRPARRRAHARPSADQRGAEGRGGRAEGRRPHSGRRWRRLRSRGRQDEELAFAAARRSASGRPSS